MRICLLNQFYAPDTAATAQLLTDLGEHLARRGHEVHVVCSRRTYDGTDVVLKRRERLAGVRVHRVRATGFGRRNLVGRLADYASFYLGAAATCLTLPRMEVCIALTTPPFVGLIGAAMKSLRGTRLVLWTMDLYPDIAIAMGAVRAKTPLARWLARTARALYRRSDAIVALGESMADRIRNAGACARNVHVVENWVPQDAVFPKPVRESAFRHELGLDDAFVVMYSGNLGVAHEFDTLLEAARALAPRAQFVFVGGGKRRTEVERRAAELALTNVHFADYRPLDALSDSLAAADVLVATMRPDAGGMVVPSKVYGMLAAGRPSVFVGDEQSETSRLLLDHDVGWVVPPGRGERLAELLAGLAADAAGRRAAGHRARALYDARFGRERSCNRITHIIESSGGNVGRPPRAVNSALTAPMTGGQCPGPTNTADGPAG
jgi:glycosyltransferase involved in cell wall biosynthesis